MVVTVEKDGLLAYEQYLLEQQIAGLGDIPGAGSNSKFDATTAPTTGDDSADGYAVGSQWIDVTNDKAYICVDATEGAAVWKELAADPSGLITTEHTHAKLVASDGSPDPALSAGADGALTAAVSLTLASGATVTEFSTDDTLAGNSDAAVPTEQAVKAYADARSPAPGCAFLAVNNAGASNVTGDATAYTVPFPTEVFDLGGDFASNAFTAPADGIYMFCVRVLIAGLTSSHTGGILRIIPSPATYVQGQIAYCNPYVCRNSNGFLLLEGSAILKLDASDSVSVVLSVSGGTKVVVLHNDDDYVQFSGYRVA